MNTLIKQWLDIWLYVLAVVAVVLIFMLIQQWNELSWVSRLVWMAVIILPFHAWEEWRLPGGLHFGYNLIMRKSDTPDIYPMNRLSDMVTICTAMCVGFFVLAYASDHELAAIGMFLFGLVEVVMHTFGGFRMLNAFRSKGKKTIYNPGLATSYVMFLPVTIGFIYLFSTGVIVTTVGDWLAGFGCFIAVVIGVVVVPELIFMNKETKFSFQDRGYWDKFSD